MKRRDKRKKLEKREQQRLKSKRLLSTEPIDELAKLRRKRDDLKRQFDDADAAWQRAITVTSMTQEGIKSIDPAL